MASELPPPGLASFRSFLPSWPVDKSTEYLVSLLRRKQVRGSKSCALATAWLLRKVVSTTRAQDPGKLINRVHAVGKQLIDAAPRELAVGNIVRRVLGAIREEEDNRLVDTPSLSESGSIPPTPGAVELPGPAFATSNMHNRRELDVNKIRPALISTQTGAGDRRPQVTSMFSMLSHPTMKPPGTASPIQSETSTPMIQSQHPTADFRAEILEAITEIIDELDQADEQIAGYALEQISPQDTIFTYSSSTTVQRFLLKAAAKRKFTVIHAEGHPNGYKKAHAAVMGRKYVEDDVDLSTDAFQKPLTALGITVILIPDSAIFAMISRANKVILSAQTVLANGSFVAAAGSKALVCAAKAFRIPVIALAATYKLSPLYPHDPFDFIEYGDVAKVIPYQDRELNLGLESIRNPVSDFIEAEKVDLFITNLGGCATGYLYRVVRDQYRDEDIRLE